jgi:hypothetical protein
MTVRLMAAAPGGSRRLARAGAPERAGSGGEAVSEESGGGSGEFAPGSQVAGYRLEEQIGRGGMAVVFRAYDSRLERYVALKILAPGLALDDAFRQRFIRESRAAAAVDDPHIIPVFEAGEERGVLFIAMRYVRGGDVRSLLDREGPLPAGRATEIITQVASALDSAHARGLVHRDVKPANMLLDASADNDRPDHVYLSDFGLTKASLSVTGLTSTGQFLGTLDYVAPEQIEGRPVDGRTDLYALACAAFELLTGEPPFRRDQGLAVMYAQISEPPPLVTSRRAGMPGEVDEVMNRALAKAPADRFATCREFAVALRRAFGLGVADSGPGARPMTEIARPVVWPSAGPGAAGGQDDTAAPGGAGGPGAGRGQEAPAATGRGPGPESQREPYQPAAGGPPTAAADYSGPRPTRPGLTEPPAGNWGGAGQSGSPVVSSGGARSWWRSRVALAVIIIVIVVIGGGGYFLLGRGGGGSSSNGNGNGGGGAVVTAPACTTLNPQAKTLSTVISHKVKIGGQPFAIRESHDGKYTFVTVGGGIAVMQNGTGPTPTLIRTIPIAHADKGLAITDNDQYLLAASASGAVVIDIAKVEQGASDVVVGTLASTAGSKAGAVQVLTSEDDKYVFVTLQFAQKMAVFNLAKALSSGFTAPNVFVGYVPLGVQPVGIARSGNTLYVTSFQAKPGPAPAPGTLSVVSMSGAETKPRTAVKSTVAAGCSPARIVVSDDSSTVWVTARDSNAVLGFSAAKLISAPSSALVARVSVGQGPIGLTLTAGGKRLVVADSNQASTSGASGDLAVISTAQALAGKPALLGVIPAPGQPRQLTVADGGSIVLAANQITGDLQVIQVASLPKNAP